MKIRVGFVSNSSSSSFIIRFPEEITSKEQLATYVEKDVLVNDKYYNFDAAKLSEAVEWVFNNMELRFSEKPDITNILAFLFGYSYEYNDDIKHLQDCDIYNMSDFCREFDISIEDQFNRSLYDIVESAITAQRSGTNKFYVVRTWDDGEELVAQLQYGALRRMFSTRIEQFNYHQDFLKKFLDNRCKAWYFVPVG